MWKLIHKIFGCHYIVMQYGYGYEVFRVRKAPNGMIYVITYSDVRPKSKWSLWEPLTFNKDDDL